MAGWLAICGSVAHLVLTPTMRTGQWSEIFSGGLWNTVTLEPSGGQLAVAEAFWLTPGSFAAPLLLLGCYVVWSSRQGNRVPGWLGWGMGVWGIAAVIMLPASPGWLFPVIGALIVLGDRRPAATPSHPAEPAKEALR